MSYYDWNDERKNGNGEISVEPVNGGAYGSSGLRGTAPDRNNNKREMYRFFFLKNKPKLEFIATFAARGFSRESARQRVTKLRRCNRQRRFCVRRSFRRTTKRYALNTTPSHPPHRRNDRENDEPTNVSTWPPFFPAFVSRLSVFHLSHEFDSYTFARSRFLNVFGEFSFVARTRRQPFRVRISGHVRSD